MSIITEDTERTLLNHYNIPSLYPEQWPAEKNDPDEVADQEEELAAKARKAKSAKRYTTLERPTHARGRGSVTGAQKDNQGKDSLVQKDEADPLGHYGSVVGLLRQRGVQVEGNTELRNQYLLSSTTFSPSLFLSHVHSTASTQQLLDGLDTLSDSIEKKSASLKVLVESNFERFVRAKATIDNVYKEMRNHGLKEAADDSAHSRKSSRQTNHFRKTSARLSSEKNMIPTEKRKNALVKEADYGTAGIKQPLLDATNKAEEVWGPALGGQEKEQNLKIALTSLEEHRVIFETGIAIEEGIKRRDYETLAEDYSRAQRQKKEAQALAERAANGGAPLNDSQIYKIVITGRVMTEVDARVEELKSDVWRKLKNSPGSRSLSATSSNDTKEEYMELIGILLQLGTDVNPIWTWLSSRHDHLKTHIMSSFEHLRADLELQRRRLASSRRPTTHALAMQLKTAQDSRNRHEADMDIKPIMFFWERQYATLSTLLAVKGGLLGDIAEFWETAQGFINGYRQRSLPLGVDGRSRHHHQLTAQSCEDLRNGATELFEIVRQQIYALYTDEPISDLSALLSPTVATTPASATTPAAARRRFSFDTSDIPPPSVDTGESWEKFAFWPPYSNSLSASTYLARINNLLGTACAEMASNNLFKTASSTTFTTSLRSLVSEVRERSILAVCAAWTVDSDRCRELEDWTRSAEKPELTNMPTRFAAFETALLTNLQKVLYVPDAAQHSNSVDVILPPSSRFVELVQKGFKNSLYKAFSGMMEHASRPSNVTNADSQDADKITIPLIRDENRADGDEFMGDSIDASNSSTRKLITISNFQYLRSSTIPSLIAVFESSFSQTISDDAKNARDALSQIHARIFQSYVRPTVDSLKSIITAGISSPSYGAPDKDGNARPTDAQPYVYDVLLKMVLVHTEVLSVTSPSTTLSGSHSAGSGNSSAPQTSHALTNQILSYLLEQVSLALLNTFRSAHTHYTLPSLMQATLDVEFLAQTLRAYTTEKASETQSEIYSALDERTDNEARQRLQAGLPEMKEILKRLRQGTAGEFGCFRRDRKRGGGSGAAERRDER